MAVKFKEIFNVNLMAAFAQSARKLCIERALETRDLGKDTD